MRRPERRDSDERVLKYRVRAFGLSRAGKCAPAVKIPGGFLYGDGARVDVVAACRHRPHAENAPSVVNRLMIAYRGILFRIGGDEASRKFHHW